MTCYETTHCETVVALAKAHARDVLIPDLPHTVYSLRQFIKTNESRPIQDPELAEQIRRQQEHLANCEAALQLFCDRLRGVTSRRRCPVCHQCTMIVGPFFGAHSAGFGDEVPICSGSGRRVKPGLYPLPAGYSLLPL